MSQYEWVGRLGRRAAGRAARRGTLLPARLLAAASTVQVRYWKWRVGDKAPLDAVTVHPGNENLPDADKRKP